MAKTVVGAFDSFAEAQRVVDDLRNRGINPDDVSIVANDARGEYSSRLSSGSSTASRQADTSTEAVSDTGTGAVTGGVLGGAAGLIAGLAGLTIPGIGPLIVAGPLAMALAGAGVGAVAGGLIGGLQHVGVPDTDAEYYAEAVRRGGALVAVRADESRADEIADVMQQHGAIDIHGRVAHWRSAGWSRFDPDAAPYTYEDIERERSTHGSKTGVVPPPLA